MLKTQQNYFVDEAQPLERRDEWADQNDLQIPRYQSGYKRHASYFHKLMQGIMALIS